MCAFLFQASIFDGLGTGFLRMLSMNIKAMLYLPQQIIITRGDIGHQMFFIHRGEVEVILLDQIVCIVCPGFRWCLCHRTLSKEDTIYRRPKT